MRFRLRRGDFEVELEGEFEYVREQFEVLQGDLRPSTQSRSPLQKLAQTDIPPEMKDSVQWQDRALKVLVDFLNRDVGKGNYVLVVTADHGHYLVLDAPEALAPGRP